jgi:hypothetical protein
MQINLDHFHYWMMAVRQSPDPMRTLDSFWRGQMNSKDWLCKELRKHIHKFVTIDIHGGWNGVLASMLFQSDVPVLNIRSVDIDPACESIASMMNKLEEMHGKFRAVTADMCAIRSDADVVINTSCEHITQEQYELWLSGMPHSSIIVLQSNNYEIPEHVRIAKDIEEFKQQSGLEHILYAGELELSLYKRFMIIGRQRV